MDTVSPVNFIPNDDGKIKKKKKSFVIVKAAMSLFRPKTEDKKLNVSKPPPSPHNHNHDHDVLINQILGTVRPLHVSDKLFPASPIRRDQSTDSFDSFGESSTVYGSSASVEDLESLHGDRLQVSDVHEGDYRRGLGKINDRSSPFASAMDLLQLGSDGESDDEDDCHVGEEEDEEDIGNDNGGDEMIDTKADDFITQFYSKMRVQG